MQNRISNWIKTNLIVYCLEWNHSEFAKTHSWIESKTYKSWIESIHCLSKDSQPYWELISRTIVSARCLEEKDKITNFRATNLAATDMQSNAKLCVIYMMVVHALNYFSRPPNSQMFACK